MIDTIRWIIGIILLGISIITILGNFGILISNLVKKRSASFVPLIGGTTGIIGVFLLPGLDWSWIFLPILGDFPTLTMLVYFGSQLITQGKVE